MNYWQMKAPEKCTVGYLEDKFRQLFTFCTFFKSLAHNVDVSFKKTTTLDQSMLTCQKKFGIFFNLYIIFLYSRKFSFFFSQWAKKWINSAKCDLRNESFLATWSRFRSNDNIWFFLHHHSILNRHFKEIFFFNTQWILKYQ